MRIGGLVLGGLAALLLIAGVAGFFLLDRVELSGFAARRASASFGRTVAISRLRVTPGRWLRVEAAGVSVANMQGGTQPEMATLRRAVAEVDAWSLLHGPVVIRAATVEGAAVLLERTADRAPNWRSGPPRAPAAEDRSGFPSLREVRLLDSELVFRTSSGARLMVRVDEGALRTAADDQPATLVLEGSYNGTKLRLNGDLQPIVVLRDASVPYGTKLRIASGAVVLGFDGTMTAPLDFDGLKGRLTLDAPTPAPILAMVGVTSELDVAVKLEGAFEHQGDLWALRDGAGTLDDDPFKAALLQIVEGRDGKPDAVTVDLAFDKLDLNGMLGTGQRGKRSGADMPLSVIRAPDTLIAAKLSARQFVYGEVSATDASIAGALTPGKIAVDTLAMTVFGMRVRATGRIEAEGTGGRVTADVTASGADAQAMRRAFGFSAMPLAGRLDGQFAVVGSGAGLNAAARNARISAIVHMRGGSVAKEVVEMASTDVRALFRTARGMSAVTCLLAGLDIRAGVGSLAPFRLRSADGVIAGSARFDLNRRVFDLTIGSESRTTSFFALDVPVRVSGAFGSPRVEPGKWTPQGRALLEAADNLSQLPAGLQEVARRNPCPR